MWKNGPDLACEDKSYARGSWVATRAALKAMPFDSGVKVVIDGWFGTGIQSPIDYSGYGCFS